MTLARDPNSFDQAVKTIIDLLGRPTVARLVERSESAVDAWSNPNVAATPSLEQAKLLDIAFQRGGGTGAPIREAYEFQVDSGVRSVAPCHDALTDEICRVMREFGEAMASCSTLVKRGASPNQIMSAAVEAKDLFDAVQDLLLRLTSFLSDGAGPAEGFDGGRPQ